MSIQLFKSLTDRSMFFLQNCSGGGGGGEGVPIKNKFSRAESHWQIRSRGFWSEKEISRFEMSRGWHHCVYHAFL